MLPAHTKQPAEKELMTLNFARRLAVGETIVSATVTATLLGVDSSATVITGVVSSVTHVSFFYQAGNDGETHKVRVLAMTSANQILEVDQDLVVKAE